MDVIPERAQARLLEVFVRGSVILPATRCDFAYEIRLWKPHYDEDCYIRLEDR
jgi:hypothetical protein